MSRDRLVKVVLQWRRFSALVALLFLGIGASIGFALYQEIRKLSQPEKTLEQITLGDPDIPPSVAGWINLGAVVGFVYAELWYSFRRPRKAPMIAKETLSIKTVETDPDSPPSSSNSALEDDESGHEPPELHTAEAAIGGRSFVSSLATTTLERDRETQSQLGTFHSAGVPSFSTAKNSSMRELFTTGDSFAVSTFSITDRSKPDKCIEDGTCNPDLTRMFTHSEARSFY